MKKAILAAAILFGLAAPALAVPTHAPHGTVKDYQHHRNSGHYYGGHIYRGPGWYFHDGWRDDRGWHEHGWWHHDHFDHGFHHGEEHHGHFGGHPAHKPLPTIEK